VSEVKWIKLNTNMFEDEKIRLIETMPDADTILVIWIKLLSQAGKTNASGYIYLNENIPYTDEMLATIFNRPLGTVRLALKTFQQFGMIEISDDQFISIANWEKHQNIAGLEKIREQTRKRVAKHREKKQLPVTGDVTLRNATEEELDIDIDIDKESNTYSNEFEQFWNEYPRKVDKKKAAKSFKSVIKKHPIDSIVNGTKKYARQVQNTEKKFIKHPATFLNNESFLYGIEEDTNDTPIRTTSQFQEGDMLF
jgi:predicted phage replisome organizer